MKHDPIVIHGHAHPPSIKLTMVGNPQHDDGAPQVCYLRVDIILGIRRGMGSFSKLEDGSLHPAGRHPLVLCTLIECSQGVNWMVTETVEEVNQLIQEAIGLKPPPTGLRVAK